MRHPEEGAKVLADSHNTSVSGSRRGAAAAGPERQGRLTRAGLMPEEEDDGRDLQKLDKGA